MRCAGCGNEIQPWANGVCYVCGRIRKEEKRFGAHPSAGKRARQTSASPPQASPARRSKGRSRLPLRSAQAKTFEPFEHCPVCDQDVPQDRLEDHMGLHTELRRPGVASGGTLKAAALPTSQPAQRPDPSATPSRDSGPNQTPLQTRRQAVNRLLADIYGKRYLLSDILRSGGVSQADITRIYQECLPNFLDELLSIWRVAFSGELAAGAWYILARSYGLDGAAPAPAEQLAQDLDVSQRRVSEIHVRTLTVLSAPASRSHLESLTIVVARRQLRRV